MHIIYKITYIPHAENKTPPYYYIGSKYNYTGGYFGSPSSRQKDWYTDGASIADWWKQQIKTKPNDFLFEVIEEINDRVLAKELVEIEKHIQLTHDVRNSPEFFNKSIATTGWASVKKSAETRMAMSAKTKEYWDTEAGAHKRKRLIERNKSKQSQIMLEKWKNPTEAMKTGGFMRQSSGLGVKRGKDKSKRRIKNNIRPIYADGLIFEDAKTAAEHFGIHPVNIRRRCRLCYNGTWRYMNEDCTDK